MNQFRKLARCSRLCPTTTGSLVEGPLLCIVPYSTEAGLTGQEIIRADQSGPYDEWSDEVDGLAEWEMFARRYFGIP